MFGWRDAVTKRPRVRDASIWLPKGNGKSPIAALIALAVLIPAKGGEKAYSAASTRHQARHVFDAAREMLKLEADAAREAGREPIRDRFNLTVEHKIRGAGDNRLYEPVSAEAGTSRASGRRS
jgi:phage terminase large subunit-like protein